MNVSTTRLNRRRVLRDGGLLASGLAVHTQSSAAATPATANDRPRIAVIGCGSRWGWQLAGGGSYGVGPDFARFGDYVAACDVDAQRLSAAGDLIGQWSKTKPGLTIDYGKILQRDDVDAVVIFTPDHWHAKIAIEAMRAGKDVYCEKPMTLTIDEGKKVVAACRETGRVFQVGTQQRSNRGFLTALALIQQGRIGTLRRVECGIGGSPTSPAIPATAPPDNLDWDRWLGPVTDRDYRSLAGAKNETGAWSNHHYEFRWWYEFSGGKLTDWGAHHVDIATLGIALSKGETDNAVPVSVNPISVTHPVPLTGGVPDVDDRYNTATAFDIEVMFPNDVSMSLRHDARNGILFEGDAGRIFVNRGGVSGRAVQDLKSRPLPEDALPAVAKGREVLDRAKRFDSLAHVEDFFRCMRTRAKPISDVFGHHRALTTCHLAGIAARLNRKLTWDPQAQRIVDDAAANKMIAREPRKGYEIQ
ncbi:MAG: Gfo/Idh/MocA family oxidoreductase [Planctomycetota bacterium]